MRGYSQAPPQATPQQAAVPFSGGVPGVVGVMPQGFSPGGVQMPLGVPMLALGQGPMGAQEGRPFFSGFDQSSARMEAPQAQTQQMPSRQEPVNPNPQPNPNANLQSLVASAQGASRMNQPTGGIDFEAIARFFQSGAPESRAILGPDGFNGFAGNISTIFNPVQSAISSGAQSILNLLKGRNGRA